MEAIRPLETMIMVVISIMDRCRRASIISESRMEGRIMLLVDQILPMDDF